MTEAYPLAWPSGWPRMSAGGRKRAKFAKKEQKSYVHSQGAYTVNKELSLADATGRVLAEMTTMGVRGGELVISTNVELRRDGLPYSGRKAPEDPGVAVYWKRKGKPQVMAIDLYDRVEDNMAAIAASLSALRAIERHGGAQILERAFTGFTALAAPEEFDPLVEMGFLRHTMPTPILINARFRTLAKERHPDSGGSTEQYQRLVNARDALLARA